MNTQHAPGAQTQLNARIQRVPAPTSSSTFTYDVAIVGLGYVGLPTALEYHGAGLRVLALDVSPDRLAAINAQTVDLVPSDAALLSTALGDDRFELTVDTAELTRARAVIICVPTPVDEFLMPDLGPLKMACATAVAAATSGQLLMLTSTTYVGCTDDLLVQPLARRGLPVGEDVFVAFSAERIDPGSVALTQDAVPRVVGGATPECEHRAVELLASYASHVHPVRSLATAEMTKLLENTFRAVNIALINEFADICLTLDVDVSEVIDAAATKPYGYMAFRPGPGVGGHCIPCDPHYLLWQLRRSRVEAPLVSAAMQQIANRPRRVVDRMRDLLAADGMPLAGSRILVMGVAYKPNVADVRESPALDILQQLRDSGAAVAYVDPHVPSVRIGHGEQLDSIADPKAFHPHLVLLHTAHLAQDLAWMPLDQLLVDATYQADLSERGVTL